MGDTNLYKLKAKVEKMQPIDCEQIKLRAAKYSTLQNQSHSVEREMDDIQEKANEDFEKAFYYYGSYKPRSSSYYSSMLNFSKLEKEWSYLAASCVKTKKSFNISSGHHNLWISPDYGVKTYRTCRHWNPWSSYGLMFGKKPAIIPGGTEAGREHPLFTTNTTTKVPQILYDGTKLEYQNMSFSFKTLKGMSQLNQDRVALFQEVTSRLYNFHSKACKLLISDQVPVQYSWKEGESNRGAVDIEKMWTLIRDMQRYSFYCHSEGSGEKVLKALQIVDCYRNLIVNVNKLNTEYLAYLSQVETYNVGWKTLNQIKNKPTKIY